MLAWLLFALTAPLLWGISNLIDQHLLREDLFDAPGLLALTGLFAIIPGAVAVTIHGLTWPGATIAILAIVAGALGCLVYLPYFYALERGSAVQVVLLWNLAPVFVVLIAWALLRERLAGAEYVAVALLILSASIASGTGRGCWRHTVPLMLAATLLLAISSVMEKAVFEQTAFPTGLTWISIGAVLVGIPFAVRRRRMLARVKPRSIGVVAGNQLLDVGAAAALSYAVSQGPVSLVKAVGGLQPVFVLLFATALGIRSASFARSIVAVSLAVVALGLVG